jgi:hypothetical protein
VPEGETRKKLPELEEPMPIVGPVQVRAVVAAVLGRLLLAPVLGQLLLAPVLGQLLLAPLLGQLLLAPAAVVKPREPPGPAPPPSTTAIMHLHPPPAQVARRSDMDMNGHINNVNYLAWALETVPQDVYDTSLLKCAARHGTACCCPCAAAAPSGSPPAGLPP